MRETQTMRRSSNVSWSDTRIASSHHGPPILTRLYEPPGARRTATVVWAHGGSWSGGSLDQWHTAITELAALSSTRFVSVDYRLTPLHTYPAAVDDVADAVSYAYNEFGPSVVVGGDSAGATIAALTAARDGHRRAVSRQILLYPPVDPTCAHYSAGAAAFPDATAMRRAWRSFAGTAGTETQASPLNVDFTGAPPADIVVGSSDPLVADCVALADHLRNHHVSVTRTQIPGMGHGVFVDPNRSAHFGLHAITASLIADAASREREEHP